MSKSQRKTQQSKGQRLTGKHPGGRPTKYNDSFNEQAYKLCLLGATDSEIADFFEVNEDTIHEWKKVYPEFSESIRRGKILADAEVAEGLYNRARGMYYDEVTFEKVDNKVNLEISSNGDIKAEDAYKKKIVTKFIPPETGAASMWLSNRQKAKWRQKIEKEDSELEFEVNIKKAGQ